MAIIDGRLTRGNARLILFASAATKIFSRFAMLFISHLMRLLSTQSLLGVAILFLATRPESGDTCTDKSTPMPAAGSKRTERDWHGQQGSEDISRTISLHDCRLLRIYRPSSMCVINRLSPGDWGRH